MSSPVIILLPQWAELILDGTKTAEVRGQNTHKRGTVLISRSGEKSIVGSVDIVDREGPVTKERFEELRELHRVDGSIQTTRAHATDQDIPYKKTFIYHLKSPIRFETPIPFERKSGPVTWARFTGSVQTI